MYAESFCIANQPLSVLLAQTIATIKTEGVAPIECADLIQKAANVVILEAEPFMDYLRAIKPDIVFVYSASFDVQEAINEAFEGQDSERQIAAFMRRHSLLAKEAEHESGGYIYFEVLALHGSYAISLGYASGACQRLLAAIDQFKEAADDEEENAREIELERIARALLIDSEFVAIRGKRKRCIYVAKKYGGTVFKSGLLARPDARSEFMDRDLVELVERVSDLLALGLQP